MGSLYELAMRVSTRLTERHADDPLALIRAKGHLASKTGFLVSLIGPGDPDDPEKLVKLKQAAAELGIAV